jgi:hypothetical protein
VQPVKQEVSEQVCVGGGDRSLVHCLAEHADDVVPQRIRGLFVVPRDFVEEHMMETLVGVNVTQ